jgi:hypothetical protein
MGTATREGRRVTPKGVRWVAAVSVACVLVAGSAGPAAAINHNPNDPGGTIINCLAPNVVVKAPQATASGYMAWTPHFIIYDYYGNLHAYQKGTTTWALYAGGFNHTIYGHWPWRTWDGRIFDYQWTTQGVRAGTAYVLSEFYDYTTGARTWHWATSYLGSNVCYQR